MIPHHADHLGCVFNPQKLAMVSKHLANKIRQDQEQFTIDAILLRGISGIAVGSVVSMLTEIPMVIVRKTKSVHSEYMMEYDKEFHHYIIIDDLVASGETIKTMCTLVPYISAKCEKLYTYIQSNRFGSMASNEIVRQFTTRWYGCEWGYDGEFFEHTIEYPIRTHTLTTPTQP